MKVITRAAAEVELARRTVPIEWAADEAFEIEMAGRHRFPARSYERAKGRRLLIFLSELVANGRGSGDGGEFLDPA